MTAPRPWLCVAPLVLCAFDLAVTLAGQPIEYWQGDYAVGLEGNPLARPLLLTGPVTFTLAVAAWALAFSLLVTHWRHSFAVVIAFLVTLGHAVCAGTWLMRAGVLGFLLAVLLLVAAERLLDWTWRRAGVR
jgi:hypothetical protein